MTIISRPDDNSGDDSSLDDAVVEYVPGYEEPPARRQRVDRSTLKYVSPQASEKLRQRVKQILEPLCIPDVAGMSPLDAALAYAEAGLYLLLVKTGKHPGSRLGTGWPAQSTCDPDTIRQWWTDYPDDGIAIHTGRSGLVALDLDVDVIPGEMAWLTTGLIQASRKGTTRRGHYVFTSTETFVSGKLKLTDGTVVGDVKSGNTVIMVAPSPHPKADDGGEYRWVTTGLMPPLPDEARAYLTTKAGLGRGGRGGSGGNTAVERVEIASNADLAAYYDAHTVEREPWRRQVFRDQYAQACGRRKAAITAGTQPDHDDKHQPAMMKVLYWSAREVEAGFVSATVFDDLYDDWLDSFGPDDRTAPSDEFPRMVATAIEAAANEDRDDLRHRGNRDFGTDHRDYIGVFDGFEFHVETSQTSGDGGKANDAGEAQGSAGEKPERSVTQCLADIAPTTVKWLWKGWIPCGKLSIFEGESDVGKSTITLDWASTVSNGAQWPDTVIDGKALVSQHDPADVMLVGVEDSNSDTVVPRLIAAGANRNRVHSLNRPVDDKGKPVPFTIPDDIAWLRKAIVGTKAELVIIDPITACLPENTKHGVDSSIRRILMSLVDLAEETGCAIVLIRHFNKAAGMNAKNRGGGSVAYSALVRSVLQAGPLIKPSDDGATFAIARAIGNLSKPPKTITYKLEDAPDIAELPTAEDEQLRVAVVKYCGTTDLTADQLVGADGAKISDARKTAPMRDDAEAALKEILHRGPMKMNDAVTEAIRLADCSKATVKNAAKKMGVVRNRVYNAKGKLDHWTWELKPDVINRNTNANNSND